MSDVVCFVNSDNEPTKVERQGLFKAEMVKDNGTYVIKVYELCKVFYPHPEAPEYASVDLLVWKKVKPQSEGLDKTFLQMYESMTALGKVCNLE